MNDTIRKIAMKSKYYANIENEEFGVDYQETFEEIFAKAIVAQCILAIQNIDEKELDWKTKAKLSVIIAKDVVGIESVV